MHERLAELEEELRVEPDEGTVELDVAVQVYAGARVSGRNDPMRFPPGRVG